VFDPRCGQEIVAFYKTERPEAFFLRVKLPKSETGRSFAASAKVKKQWSLPPIPHVPLWRAYE